jgi:hypothetical protein
MKQIYDWDGEEAEIDEGLVEPDLVDPDLEANTPGVRFENDANNTMNFLLNRTMNMQLQMLFSRSITEQRLQEWICRLLQRSRTMKAMPTMPTTGLSKWGLCSQLPKSCNI